MASQTAANVNRPQPLNCFALGHRALDTDRDGIIQRREFYSNNTKVGLGGMGIKDGRLMDGMEEDFQNPSLLFNHQKPKG
jgi:hypothetical protein